MKLPTKIKANEELVSVFHLFLMRTFPYAIVAPRCCNFDKNLGFCEILQEKSRFCKKIEILQEKSNRVKYSLRSPPVSHLTSGKCKCLH